MFRLYCVLTLVGAFLREGGADKCDESQRANYVVAERYQKSCYFHIWGIITKVHTRLENDFVLDVGLSRKICNYFNATLLVIDSKDEEEFLSSISKEGDKYVLGIVRDGSKDMWEDGTAITYTNKNWRKEQNECQYTLMIMGDQSKTYWQDFSCSTRHADPVDILCEETDYPRSIPNRPSEPPWNEKDKCDPMNGHRFRQAKRFENESCYFEVRDGDQMVNTLAYKEQGFSYFTFNVDLARNICNSYNATLPGLGSEEEEWFLIELNAQNFNFIALGIKRSGNEYWWEDGKPITFQNSDWRKQESPGIYYTLLVFAAGEGNRPYWMEVTMNESILNGVPLICEEIYKTPPASRTTQIPGSVHDSMTSGNGCQQIESFLLAAFLLGMNIFLLI